MNFCVEVFLRKLNFIYKASIICCPEARKPSPSNIFHQKVRLHAAPPSPLPYWDMTFAICKTEAWRQVFQKANTFLCCSLSHLVRWKFLSDVTLPLWSWLYKANVFKIKKKSWVLKKSWVYFGRDGSVVKTCTTFPEDRSSVFSTHHFGQLTTNHSSPRGPDTLFCSP